MTLSRKVLKRTNSPLKSPKLANSSLRKKALIKKLNNDVQFGGASKANLKVVVRVRPENQREIENNSRSIIDVVDEHLLVFDPSYSDEGFFFHGEKQKFRDLNKRNHKEQKFMFERVFGPESNNVDIFETTTKDIVGTLLNGYNCSVFAYGATGAGKTFTMIGNQETPGITFLTVMELYNKIEELSDKHCEVGVSYLEVYNEMVRDLLAPGKMLNLHENGHTVQVTGLSLHKPKDAADLLRILAEGNKNRSQHPTDANAESSRSHAVFQVFVKQSDKASGIASRVSIAKLSMIDLAGSERGASTGFKGARFREGANINKSLLALGNCINALADGKRHIPYRDSKLTRLLKDSLGGNCQSVMIAAVSRSAMTFEDSYNTLKYANRAKTIKTMLRKNEVNVDQHVSQYVKIVEDLQSEVSSLKEKIKELSECKILSPQIQDIGLSVDERVTYENTIQVLKNRLEESETSLSDEEKCILNTLQDLHCQLKGYRREILQLDASERELELKIYTQRLEVTRMNILSFASMKLDKGIVRRERTIEILTSNFKHIELRKNYLHEKLSMTKSSILKLCETLQQMEPPNVSLLKNLETRLKQNELEQTIRDSHQSNEYLKDLVKKLLSNQTNSDKLILSMLVAIKQFYLKLKTFNKNDSVIDEMFENILSLVNVNRLEWADLKDTENSFGEEILSKFIPNHPPYIDENKLINMPVYSSFNVSPVIISPLKLCRRSIIKNSQPKMRKVEEANLLSPVSESNMGDNNAILRKPKVLSFSSRLDIDSEDSILPVKPVDVIGSSFAPSKVNLNLEMHSNEPELSPSQNINKSGENSFQNTVMTSIAFANHDISGVELLEESPLCQSLNATFEVSSLNREPVAKVPLSYPAMDSVPQEVATTNFSSENTMNSTITLSCKSNGEDSVEAFHFEDEIKVDDSSLQDAIINVTEPSVPVVPTFINADSSQCNSTFFVESSNANETFSLSDDAAVKIALPSKENRVLQESPQNINFKTDMPPPTKVYSKKPFKASKMSYCRLPSNVSKSTENSLKRSCSVPSIPGGSWNKPRPYSSSKFQSTSPKNSLTRSTSFAKAKPVSSQLNSKKENTPNKFYPTSTGNKVSKNVFNFFSSKSNSEIKHSLNQEKTNMESNNKWK